MNAVGAGLERGWIEFRHRITSPWELWGELWPWVIALVVMYTLRGKTVPGTDFSLGAQAVPGILGVIVVYTGLLGLSLALTTEREDGTLLRMKAVPNGMLGYVVGKVVSRTGVTIACVILMLVPSVLVFDGLAVGRASTWVTFVWVLALGLLALVPLGAVIGAVSSGMQSIGLVSVPVMALLAISGIFYPITALPEWVQTIAQIFPVYWLGLGMRSALLPDALATAEIGDSWRHAETVGVLGAWAVLGFLIAPVVLRRMTRRATGTTVKQAKVATDSA
ncbi:ABC transporter permease [Dactylosporangium fulvum]|uniref:ABC transporter permease n=1 Tax=Dactylosporangium fulvum TaxID=53359 RepID=A0ABY5W6H6_9ACTN|nr:ABC transporter permease [Dactylosporangium fulvum]UWP84936.1 ABC transporter permease [Dactylosporangium fulvum]